jgi:hypothetical protein
VYKTPPTGLAATRRRLVDSILLKLDSFCYF